MLAYWPERISRCLEEGEEGAEEDAAIARAHRACVICDAQQTGIRHVIVEALLILHLADRRSSSVLKEYT